MSFYAFKKELYLFGGTNKKQVFNDFHMFNLETRAWTKLKQNLEN